jgi:hypothetical protein
MFLEEDKLNKRKNKLIIFLPNLRKNKNIL